MTKIVGGLRIPELGDGNDWPQHLEDLATDVEDTYLSRLGPAQSRTYNADGTIDTVTVGSTTYTYVYNALGQVSTISDGTSTATYTYNADGTVALVEVS